MTLKQFFTYVGATIPILAAIWAVLEYTDTRYTFFFEHRALAADVSENTERLLEFEMRDFRLQQKQNMRDQREFVKENQPVPDWLLEEETDLQIQIERIQRKIEAIRDD